MHKCAATWKFFFGFFSQLTVFPSNSFCIASFILPLYLDSIVTFLKYGRGWTVKKKFYDVINQLVSIIYQKPVQQLSNKYELFSAVVSVFRNSEHLCKIIIYATVSAVLARRQHSYRLRDSLGFASTVAQSITGWNRLLPKKTSSAEMLLNQRKRSWQHSCEAKI